MILVSIFLDFPNFLTMTVYYFYHDNSHQKDDRKKRDSFVNNALLKAGYTVVWTNGNIEPIKKALFEKGYQVKQTNKTQ